jgi:hypothetical protein
MPISEMIKASCKFFHHSIEKYYKLGHAIDIDDFIVI